MNGSSREPVDREIRLGDLVGTPVVSSTGTPVGRVVDLTLRLGDGDATVDRLQLRGPRRRQALVEWDEVASVGPDRVVLRPDAVVLPTSASQSPNLADDELLLSRDVLDTQVVDLDGQRLARVGDVILGRTDEGRLAAVAVDTGFGAVCRRIGARRLARRFDERAVAWNSLHLTSARGHVVQLTTPAATLHRLDATEVGLLLDAVTTTSGLDIVRVVDPDVAAAALVASHPHTAARLVRSLHEPEVTEILRRLPRHHARRLADHRAAGPPERRLLRHAGWRRRVPARRDDA